MQVTTSFFLNSFKVVNRNSYATYFFTPQITFHFQRHSLLLRIIALQFKINTKHYATLALKNVCQLVLFSFPFQINEMKKLNKNLQQKITNIFIHLFQLIGLVIVVGAAIILADPYNALSVGQDPNNYYIGLSIVLVVGIVLIIVAFLGCCGAFKESQCLLITFFCFLLIVVTAQIAAGAWAYTNKDKLNDVFRQTVKYTVQEEYSVLPTRTVTFDGVQQFVSLTLFNV